MQTGKYEYKDWVLEDSKGLLLIMLDGIMAAWQC